MLGIRLVPSILVVMSVLSATRAEEASFSDVIPCDGTLSFEEAMENDVMYNQVYNWMHNREIKKWTYTGVEAPPALREKFAVPANTSLVCAEVSYMADLPLPNAFTLFLSHLGLDADVPIRVHKTACASKSAIFEQAEVQELVVKTVSIETVHEITEQGLRSSTEVRLEVPWYAQMISRMILAHIGVSVAEKNVAVRDSVCRVLAPGLPAWNASYKQGPDYADMVHLHLRQKKLPNVAGRRVPHLWRLQRDFVNETFGCRNCSVKTDEAEVEVEV